MKRLSLIVALVVVSLMVLSQTEISASNGQIMISPVSGTVSLEFGVPNPYDSWRPHTGIDIASPRGTPIYAPSNGTVKSTGWGSNGEGNYIVIFHIPGDSNRYRRYCPRENWTKYYHLDSILVQSGQSVTQGQLIGRVGKTGNSSGHHLHFEVRENGQYGTAMNPREYIRFGDGKDIW